MNKYLLPPAIRGAIARERIYQQQKWGQRTDDGGEPSHDVGAWLSILRVELREAEEEWCGQHGDHGALCEILQVVSVGIACLEEHGVVERHELKPR